MRQALTTTMQRVTVSTVAMMMQIMLVMKMTVLNDGDNNSDDADGWR